MFRDLRAKVSARRRLVAWALLGLLLVVAAFGLPRVTSHPAVHFTADVILWSALAYGAIRLVSFLLLDPLLSQRQTATPGFAREGFRLMGPHGPTPLVAQAEPTPGLSLMGEIVRELGLPDHWAEDLRPHLRRRFLAPGEGVIREGDPGDSLFAVHRGTLQVVRVEERQEPYTGLFWKPLAELAPGQWFGVD